MATAAGIVEPEDLENLADGQLVGAAILFIKRNSLHGPFIDALPSTNLPGLAIQFLNRTVEVAGGTETGLVQL